MATSYTVDIPNINGSFEAGVSVVVDPDLPDNEKLPVLYRNNAPAELEQVRSNALMWAFKNPLFQTQDARSMVLNAIAAIFDLGLVAHLDGVPDGCWKRTDTATAGTGEEARAISTIVDLETMKKMVALAVCTKANFWMINHHLGQGGPAGYVAKYLRILFADMLNKDKEHCAYVIGHWISTRFVLRVADIRAIIPVTSVVRNPGAHLSLSDVCKLRMASPPAGTHRMAVAYEGAKRLLSNTLAPLCPGVNDFAVIAGARLIVNTCPAKYHVRAVYLTGTKNTDHTDSSMDHYLGRIGTFINTLRPKSTLAGSPYIAKSRLEGYEDYNVTWKRICETYKTAADVTLENAIAKVTGDYARATAQEIANLLNSFQ